MVFAVLRDGRGWLLSCARRMPCSGRRTPGCGRRTRSRRLSWRGCGLTWRVCSGCCSGGPRSGRVRDPPRSVTELLDWRVVVRVAAHCRRRYRRACSCRVPAAVTAPGPPKAIGKGLFSNAFIAMLFTERYVAGRSMNSLVTGLSRQGAEISPATLAGTCAQAGALLAPVAEAVTERSRGSWHLHADETTWRVFAPREGDGPAKWWLWVFLGPDTCCFVMDPTRSGAVLARHAGIDEKTGQLTDDGDGGPRRLVISSDFYKVYESAGKKADGLVNLYCWAHVRRHFVRAGDASPVQLKYWTEAWLERIRDLYSAHDELMAAWQDAAAPAAQEKTAAAARLEEAYTAWDDAIAVIDEARKDQAKAPGLQEPARKALATLEREWDGLTAHRDYPVIGLDNYPDVAVMPKSGLGGAVSAGRGGGLAAELSEEVAGQYVAVRRRERSF